MLACLQPSNTQPPLGQKHNSKRGNIFHLIKVFPNARFDYDLPRIASNTKESVKCPDLQNSSQKKFSP
jgi:hypothetical protein